MPRSKEILISSIKPVSREDLKTKFVVFEYKGRVSEINEFINLVKQAGLNSNILPEEQPEVGVSQLRMAFLREDFLTFMTILHE